MFYANCDEEAAKPDEARGAMEFNNGPMPARCSQQSSNSREHPLAFSLSIVDRHEIFGFTRLAILWIGMSLALLSTAYGTVDNALSFAYEAALPYSKQYAIRKDAWGGDLGIKEKKAVMTQLFKGNDYWFVMASDVKGAKISVHLYDTAGNLAESDAWQHAHDKKHYVSAGAHIVPEKTGTYFAIVEVVKSPEERTPWALVYGYKDDKEKESQDSK